MIGIRMFGDEWRISIGDETWEFPDLKTMQKNLETLLEMKDKYGRLK